MASFTLFYIQLVPLKIILDTNIHCEIPHLFSSVRNSPIASELHVVWKWWLQVYLDRVSRCEVNPCIVGKNLTVFISDSSATSVPALLCPSLEMHIPRCIPWSRRSEGLCLRVGRLSSQDCSGNKRPPAEHRNLGVSPHIFAHKHSGLQNNDDRGDPNVLSVEEHMLGCILSTPTLEHALAAPSEPSGFTRSWCFSEQGKHQNSTKNKNSIFEITARRRRNIFSSCLRELLAERKNNVTLLQRKLSDGRRRWKVNSISGSLEAGGMPQIESRLCF